LIANILKLLIIASLLAVSACSVNPVSKRLVLEGVGTPGACLASDAMCIQEKAETACLAMRELKDPIDACLSWLQQLQIEAEQGAQQELNEPEIQLALAYTNYRLGELPSWPSLKNQSARLLGFEKYRQESLRL